MAQPDEALRELNRERRPISSRRSPTTISGWGLNAGQTTLAAIAQLTGARILNR